MARAMMHTTPPCSSVTTTRSHPSHGFSPRHSVLTVVIKPVNDGLEAVVLDYHILDAVVSTHDVFPSVNIQIDFDYDTRY